MAHRKQVSFDVLIDIDKRLGVWKIMKEMRISDHLTCLLRNLYAGQEATVRTGHGTTDWFKIGKGVHQGCISEVIDISPGNLDSSWCFFQPSVSHDVLCIEVK